MKGSLKRKGGRSALDLVEEAVHLLRSVPASTLVIYYAGALPFVLGLLFFWADMSQSPFARRHVVEAALGVTALFVWMKVFQNLFTRRLRAHCAGETLIPLGPKRIFQIALTQVALQPTGLFLLPIAAIPILPLPWLFGFYQNLTVTADRDFTGLRDLIRKTIRHTALWPRQNHVGLFYLAAFAFFVFLNFTIVCFGLPSLIHSLLGIETVFSRGGMAMLNTTFFATMFAATYLCVDPIVKAFYTLRCFYGESIQSGADLRAELQRFSPTAAQLAALILLCLTLTAPVSARAAEPTPAPAPEKAISSEDLNQSIDKVIQQRKYTWRMPRDKAAEEPGGEEGVLAKFFNNIGRMIRDALKGFFEWLGKGLQSILRKLFGGWTWSPRTGSSFDWATISRALLYVLVCVVVGAALILFYRLWRNRQRKPEVFETEAIQSLPDITDENVGADQLPEDGWTKMAKDLFARGEFRLALRAFYLASLAHLAERNLISLARFKSNHDYERELGRRAHALPVVQQLFEQNVSSFDRVWYGTYEATSDLVTQFASNVERIKAGG